MGNEHPSIVPYQLLECADGPLAVACGNDGQFPRFTDRLGRPGLPTTYASPPIAPGSATAAS